MKTVIVNNISTVESVETFEGEYLEEKVERITQQNEPIKDGAPIIFTEKKMGVLPAYNPRTDRFDLAIEGMQKAEALKVAKRNEKADVADVPAKTEGGSPTEN